jgi:hypothetical protein
MKFLLILLMGSSLGEPQGHSVRFNVQGQEQCEAICLSCINNGGEPEECVENMIFRLCCYQNGGHTSGCGCREGL